MDPEMLQALSGGTSWLGGMLGGIGDFFAAKNQAKAYGYAAQQASQEAGVAASQALTEGERVTAHAATQAAANGGGFTGSTMAVLGDLAGQSYFRARAAAYRGATEVQNDRYQQKLAKRAGVLSLISGVTGGTSSLLGGWAKSQMANKQAQYLSTLRGMSSDAGGGSMTSTGSGPFGGASGGFAGPAGASGGFGTDPGASGVDELAGLY